MQKAASESGVNTMLLDDLESRLDDLLICQSLVKEYAEREGTSNDDISSFSSQVNKVFRKFRGAVCGITGSKAERHIEGCVEAYEKALDGSNDIGKFYRHWKKISTINVSWKLFLKN